MDRLLTARWVLPVSAPPLRDGAVLVRGGRIESVGPRAGVEPRAAGLPRLDLGETALLPGFVDAHTHLELCVFRGLLEEPDFFRWVRRLTRLKYSALDARDFLASARWAALDATRAGVTTVGEVCDLGVSPRAISESGLRAVVWQEVFGPEPGVADERFAALRERVAAHRAAAGDRVTVGVSPHAPYSVSPRLFTRVAEWAAAEGLPVTVHLAESRAEGELVRRGGGAFAAMFRRRGIPWETPGVSPVAWLERLGVLAARPLLVHMVDVAPDDLERVARAGCAVAHCPRSNLKFGHGPASLGAFRRAGLRVGLGTDGVSSQGSSDLLEELRVASLLARGIRGPRPSSGTAWAAGDALRLLTLGGAEALGLDREIGSLEPGKRADLTAVSLEGEHLRPVHDVEATLAWSARGSDVVWSAVDGEPLLEEGRPRRLDPEALRSPLEHAAEKLRAAAREAASDA